MMWLQFAFSSIVIVLAANQLAKDGDVIALRTRLGGMFIGTLLLSTATSLPELLTTFNAISQAVPNLAAGNIFGSCMFNMVMLAVLDIIDRRVYVLRSVAITHALSASMAMLLTGLAVFFLLGNFPLQVGWVGVDSLVLIGIYVFCVWLIQQSNITAVQAEEPTALDLAKLPSLRRAVIGFAAGTAVLVLVTPLLVSSAVEIADVTGLGTGFIGTTLIAIVTSLPELVTTVAASRIGAYDLAVGNLFGSNIFNIFTLGLADVFFIQGRFLSNINATLATVGVMSLVLTTLGMIGMLAKIERRSFFIQINALLIIGYIVGMIVLYQ